jgi:murein tripeptide amidase MpaA
MPTPAFDRYYRYDELSDLLHQFQAEHPSLVQLESIGKSYEGRDIWMAIVTNQATGPHLEKPAFWCDGNIHASEVSASTAVLMVLHKLVSGEGHPILSTHTFYLVPRLNPDGAEWSLESPPRVIRSSTRPYPFEDEDVVGLERQDMDGDGRILSMRIKDANGPWAVAEEEPRLLKRREPGDQGGQYYRVLPEGIFHNFDGLTMRPRRVTQGLDMNRNFPNGWRGEHEQAGAGPYPTSEPEIRAAVDTICRHTNICGAVTFHTFSGVHLRPPSAKSDEEIPAEDLWAYQTIGKKGTEMTGYPAISVYHEFRYHPKQVITGVFDDWMFEMRGVYAWTTEIWSPQKQAGIADYKYIDWFRDHPFDDELKLLKWSDDQLDGLGYVDWVPFNHPQLGEVEIGGWDSHYAFRNPPSKFLEKEVGPLADWAIWQAGCAPRLTIREQRIQRFGDAWRIQIVVQNSGWLPTTVTKLAAEKGLTRGVRGSISRGQMSNRGGPLPGWLVSGELVQDAGQLRGWSEVPVSGFGWHTDATDDIAVFEWVVSEHGAYEIVVQHERAGTIRLNVSA